MDPATISGILTVGTHVMSLLKGTAEAMRAAGKPELMGPLVEAQAAMMDLLYKQQGLLDENRELREKVRTLEEALRFHGELIHRHSAYWRRLDDGTLDGPFATPPWDVERRLVRMQRQSGTLHGGLPATYFLDPASKTKAIVPQSFLVSERARAAEDEPHDTETAG